jgi:hypothetical protein
MAVEEEAPKKEPNYFRSTLVGCRDSLIPGCRDAVHEGAGSPLDAIAGPISDGGWECAEADSWVAELRERCADLLTPFDEAISTVGARISGEPDQVPENDWRGYSWSRTWAHQRRMI